MNSAKRSTRPKTSVRKSGRPTPVKSGVFSKKNKDEKDLNSPVKTKTKVKKDTSREEQTQLTFGQININNASNREKYIVDEKPSPSKSAYEFKVIKNPKANDDTHAERSNSFDGLDQLTANMRTQGTSMDSMPIPREPAKTNIRKKLSKDTQLCFMYIKPHCSGIRGIDKLVVDMLNESGVEIIERGTVSGSNIASHGLVDTHYSTMSNRAMVLQPSELVVPAMGQAEFQKVFGMGWARAVEESLVKNASDAAVCAGVDGTALNALWRKIPPCDIVRLGRNFYCGKLNLQEDDYIYVINGFYLALRNAYSNPATKITWFSVKLPTTLTWDKFRSDVVGSSDPLKSPEDSIRHRLLLQIDSSVEVQAALVNDQEDNFIHASASPLEAMYERLNWIGRDGIENDHFGSQLIEADISMETILNWRSDPTVIFEGSPQSLFDIHENIDTLPCVRKAVEVSASEKRVCELRRRQLLDT